MVGVRQSGPAFSWAAGEGALKTRLYETLRTRLKVGEIRDLCFELGVNDEEFSPQLGLSSLARELVAHCERRGQLALLEAAVRRLRGELAEPQAQDELVIHAFARLRECPQCLLILDNVVDPAALDEPLTGDCVPARLPGRVLFTTRRRELGLFRPVELKTLPPDAALKLLLRDPRRQPVLNPTHSEHEIACDICAVFGYLPLALEMAAAHLGKKRTRSLADYRRELMMRGALEVVADQHVDVHTRHDTGLLAVLTTQWMILSTEAQMLLRVAGQFQEAAYIPSARLGLLSGMDNRSTSFFAVTLNDALAELDDSSLIEDLTDEQVRLHPLVRVFAQRQVVDNAAFSEACIGRLLAAFGDIETMERQCDARGIDALMKDLIAAEFLFTRDLFLHETRIELTHALRTYLRVLRREAHNLRGWRRDDAPVFLAQQLYLRLVNSQTPTLFGDLTSHLRSRGQGWRTCWAWRNESMGLEMILAGHEAWVNAVAVTPNGRRAVSGGDDGTLRVWNLDTDESERTLTGHADGVWAVAVTPDGWRTVSGGGDGALRVWNLVVGDSARALTAHERSVSAVAVMPDRRRVVSGGHDGTLRIWNLDTGETDMLIGYENGGWAMTVTPDGRRAVCGSFDGTVHVLNLDRVQAEQTLIRHKRMVVAVAVTPDGRRAISGSDDRTLRVWNLDTGAVEQTLTGHAGGVQAVAVTPDGRRAISGSDDRTLRVWNLDTGAVERALTGHAYWVNAVAVTPDGRRIVSGGEDGTLRVWNLETGQAERTLTGHSRGVRGVAMTADGRQVVSGGDDRTLRMWDFDAGRELARAVLDAAVTCLAIAPGHPPLVVAGDAAGGVYCLEWVE